MPTERTYTIAEAAALAGLHRNTIRMRVKLGQIQATVHAGKFGDEYRISHSALVQAGLLAAEGPLGERESTAETEVLTAVPVDAEPEETPAEAPPPGATVAALSELYQRHEQAMFRLGYLQGELERLKALAETAESLQEDNLARRAEVDDLRRALEERRQREAEAEALRARNEALQQELERERARLAELETVRRDLEELKAMAARKRSWWERLVGG